MCHASRDRGCDTAGHVTPLLMSLMLSAPALLAVAEVSRSLVIIKENQTEGETFIDTERIWNFYACMIPVFSDLPSQHLGLGGAAKPLAFRFPTTQANFNCVLNSVPPSFLFYLSMMTLVLSRNVWVEMMGGSQEPRPSPGVTGPGHVQPGVRPNTCRLLSQWSTTQI